MRSACSLFLNNLNVDPRSTFVVPGTPHNALLFLGNLIISLDFASKQHIVVGQPEKPKDQFVAPN